jgi:dipeptidase E
MKLLLTSAGVKNESIMKSLIEMLGKPISESNALCIPTAIYAIPNGPRHAWDFLSGQATTPMCELGWKSMGVLELTALPSIDKELWIPKVKEADVILVNGGDPLYLNYWMNQSGLAELLPTLNVVYVGLSAGSMIMAPRIGYDFVGWTQPEMTDKTLNYVNFAIFPHLDHEMLPDNKMENAVKWAESMDCDCYAMDDQTAIKVVEGVVEVITEGNWKVFKK